MTRLLALGVVLLCGLSAQGREHARQGDPVHVGHITRIDPQRATITIAADGAAQEYQMTPRTRLALRGTEGLLDLTDPRLKAGAEVRFKATQRRGQALLARLLVTEPNKAPLPKTESSNLKALTDLGTGQYKGFQGGLYPGGSNERPAAHEAAGLALARSIQPLDAEGRASPDGTIVLLAVGMSNTKQVYTAFQHRANADGSKNPRLILVNGAQGSMSAGRIVDPGDGGSGTRYWAEVDHQLRSAGVTRAQVQVAWIKEADQHPSAGFPDHARTLQAELAGIVRDLHDRFPNLKLVYLSSRSYGGYARSTLNPEPYAYESAFSVRWLIEQQLKGDPELNYDPARGAVRAPWLSWGPYLWANGATPRADGLFYTVNDYMEDGTHPSPLGREKIARLLLDFFKTDSTTRPWFVSP